jgi:hypothetical protein
LPSRTARDADPSIDRRPVVTCDATRAEPTLDAVDALCRTALAARRAGCELRLRNVAPALRELLLLCGVAARLGVEDR